VSVTEIRTIRPEDAPAVVQAWNQHMIHSPVTEDQFRRVIMDDPNFSAPGHLLAERDGTVVGSVSAICRHGVAGADGRGRADHADRGYIRDIFADSQSTLDALLTPGLAFLRQQGKTHILTGEYTGRYITPGVDSRYDALSTLLRERFDCESTVDDMEADLRLPLPNEHQRRAEQSAREYGVHFERYEPSMLPAMRGFAAALGIDQWFPPGWEAGYGAQHLAFVARKGEQIVGWTDYAPEDTAMSLGPMGVAPEHRGHGIGSCLVLACMREGQRCGLDRIWAGWTNSPFYVPNGWRVFRQFIVFEKQLVAAPQ
jgi:predicted N-acetyltransferase YhbS